MKKYVKIIGIAILTIWIIFIITDCIRLNTSNINKKPIITIMTNEYAEVGRYGTEYIGLGYSVKHYNMINSAGYGTIVYLFYIIPLPYIEAQ